MQNPSEQLKELRSRLTRHITVLDAKLEMCEYLVDCTRDDRIEVLNLLPAFFKYVEDSLLTDIVLTLSKIYDDSRRAKRSLVHYLRLVVEHFSALQPTQNHLTKLLVQQQLADIASQQEKLENLKHHRDKWRAHHDKKYFDAP